jgi:single-stranded-DNA-specific exonuclease
MLAAMPLATSTCDAFLGVEKSATDRRWIARDYDERLALALAQRHALPDLIARSLAARGVGLEDAAGFLDPRLRDFLPNPSALRDMDAAATRLAEAIRHGESIAVFGDYDVDGATSSALLMRFARAAGIELRLYVPDRLREGYGPNVEAMQRLAGEGVKLIICVDCGTTAHEPLKAAKDAGCDVIVLDHHASEPALPPAAALVNPNRLDESNAYGALAAVGVTYLFVVAVNRALRETGWWSPDRPEPDLLAWLDLVALGTVCDVVKLTGLNRALVAQGLRVMSQRRNAGISALADVAGQKGPMDTYAAGFILGPRVNAGGRVGEADTGAKLLATDDPAVATRLAQHLHTLNNERRALEAQVLAEAEAITLTENLPMAFVARENWHPGVIGIVASRLKDRFHHPALVIALDGDIGKGSGRSSGSVDLGAAIIAARQAGLLINGGGHKMAAGFTVAREKIEALRDFLAERIGKQIAAEPLIPTLTLDGLATAPALQPDFIKKLAALGPFGSGNAEPRFALADCRILRADIVGEKHVSVLVLQGGARIRGIAFRAIESGLGKLLLDPNCRDCHLAGHLRLDEWQGEERVQLCIDDAAPAGKSGHAPRLA